MTIFVQRILEKTEVFIVTERNNVIVRLLSRYSTGESPVG